MSITQPTTTGFGAARIEREIAGIVAGQRMAGMEPTEADIAILRRQLRGELTLEQATELAVEAAEARFR
jgi:hypothetical protein